MCFLKKSYILNNKLEMEDFIETHKIVLFPPPANILDKNTQKVLLQIQEKIVELIKDGRKEQPTACSITCNMFEFKWNLFGFFPPIMQINVSDKTKVSNHIMSHRTFMDFECDNI